MSRRPFPPRDPELRRDGSEWADKPVAKDGTNTLFHKRRYWRMQAQIRANEIASELYHLTLLRRWEYGEDNEIDPDDVEQIFAWLTQEMDLAQEAMLDRKKTYDAPRYFRTHHSLPGGGTGFPKIEYAAPPRRSRQGR